MIFIDASQLRLYTECRESYRRTYVANEVPVGVPIHKFYGIGVHMAIDQFWQGKPFTTALEVADAFLDSTDLTGVSTKDQAKWHEMREYLPDLLALYYDGTAYTPDEVVGIEEEWTLAEPFGIKGVTLCGRKDRVMTGGRLFDAKTATDMGGTWRADYKATMLRDYGLALYDWHEAQTRVAPTMVTLEILVKPSKAWSNRAAKPARLELMEMPEIPLLRRRFEQQLKWLIQELEHAHEHYAEAKPWIMSQSACRSVYSMCPHLVACNGGKVKYVPRVEHIEARAAVNGLELRK